MIDVFISYKREERPKAQAIAQLLADRGYSIWWDIDLLPGDRFSQEITEIIQKATTAIVLWSKLSVESDFVVDEASLARDRDILIPVKLDDCNVPIGFRSLHTLDLQEWDGNPNDSSLELLISAVEKCSAPSKPQLEKNAQSNVKLYVDEANFWRAISEHSNQSSDEYRKYLEDYGENATFAELAKLRIKALSNSEKKKKSFGLKKAITVVTLIGGIILILLNFAKFLEMISNKEPPKPIVSVKTYEIGRDGDLIAYRNGIIEDQKTGLEWIAGPDVRMNWIQAKSWIDRLTVGGGGWHMPDTKQYQTLLKVGLGTSNMTSLVKMKTPDKIRFWTAETEGEKAKLISSGGITHLGLKTLGANSMRVFAVRTKNISVRH